VLAGRHKELEAEYRKEMEGHNLIGWNGARRVWYQYGCSGQIGSFPQAKRVEIGPVKQAIEKREISCFFEA
jgi:hypothetical protein